MIDLASHLQPGIGGRGADQLYDGLMTDERLAAPVLRDERKQAVLDLVPLAGAGRQMTDRDGDAELVRQVLQLTLPQSDADAVAAAAISPDQEPRPSPNPNAARLFQSFCFSPDAQQLVIDFGGFRSIHPQTRDKAGRKPFADIKTMKDDASAVEMQGEEIRARYSRLFKV